MKRILIFLLIIFTITFVFACATTENGEENKTTLKEFSVVFDSKTVSYDGNEHSLSVSNAPEGTTIEYTNNKQTEVGDYVVEAKLSKDGYKDKTITANLSILPISSQLVSARVQTNNASESSYKFKLNFNGSIEMYGLPFSANANYEARYKYNKTTNEMKFVKETSGLLLPDTKEYIFNSGINKINVKVNPDTGDVKKVSIQTEEDAELTMINIPFAAIIDALTDKNIIDIQKNEDGDSRFKYAAMLKMETSNGLLNGVLNAIGNLGTSVEIKNVQFSNPVSGIKLYFNYSDHEFMDFKFAADIAFPVAGINTKIAITYEQFKDNQNIIIPNLDGFSVNRVDVNNTINSINSALEDINNDPTYSIGLKAINEFDPGWNKKAIKDSYEALLYKNTIIDGETDRVDFNHSYEYKVHTEEDGAETFKYTIANLQDGSVHKVSRKGTNQITAADELSLSTQFNYLFNAANITADDVDCVTKKENGELLEYELFLTKASTISIQNKILEIVNSNDADGVLDVDNYFDPSNYSIEEASIEVVITAGKLTSINVTTEIKYNPTSEEYVDEIIILTNVIELKVNEWYSYAEEYEAPKSTSTGLSGYGLNNFKFYIL